MYIWMDGWVDGCCDGLLWKPFTYTRPFGCGTLLQTNLAASTLLQVSSDTSSTGGGMSVQDSCVLVMLQAKQVIFLGGASFGEFPTGVLLRLWRVFL